MGWQRLSGVAFALALAAGVIWGGQTIDVSWGPALLGLAVALLMALPLVGRQARGTKGATVALALTGLAAAWIFWRAAGSPVKEFARADALLAAAMLAGLAWARLMPAAGAGWKIFTAGLALLCFANLGVAAWQLKEPAFAWPFLSRPAKLPSGLFGHYNHLSDFCVAAAVILAARFKAGADGTALRALQVAGAIAAVICTGISGSRGGAVALGVAGTVLFATWAVISWRDKSPQRRTMIGLALLGPVVAALLALPVIQMQEARRGLTSGSVQDTADNATRLNFLQLAVDAAAREDTWSGGGSRSFGWRKYRSWDPQANGAWGQTNDDLVHNELIQTLVDYGAIGALLVATAALATALSGVAGLALRTAPDPAADAMASGGLAALAGTVLHSNFSFVTHTLPGALYLGLALGMALPRRSERGGIGVAAVTRVWLPRLALAPAALVLGIAGWQATSAFRQVWPVWYGDANLARRDPSASVERSERALETWPDSETAGRAGMLARLTAERISYDSDEQRRWLEVSASLYDRAASLHPLDPEWAVNRAHVYELLGRSAEAEQEYRRGVELQGGMESTFRARYFLAGQIYRRWYGVWTHGKEAGREEIALHQFLAARALMKEAEAITPGSVWGEEGRKAMEGLEESISFLEGAKVIPRAPDKSPEISR